MIVLLRMHVKYNNNGTQWLYNTKHKGTNILSTIILHGEQGEQHVERGGVQAVKSCASVYIYMCPAMSCLDVCESR